MTVPSGCIGCGATPCDCEAEIWNYYFKDPVGPVSMGHAGGRSRGESLHLRDMASNMLFAVAMRHADDPTRAFVIGPVQRCTDPPYDFKNGPVCPQALGHQGTAGPPGGPPIALTPMMRFGIEKAEIAGLLRDDPFPNPPGVQAFFKNITPVIAVTQDELARLLFDTQAYITRCADTLAEQPERKGRTLDIMWVDEAFKELRERCERRAARVFDRARSDT